MQEITDGVQTLSMGKNQQWKRPTEERKRSWNGRFALFSLLVAPIQLSFLMLYIRSRVYIMEESIFKYLLDYGSLGITAGLLFWLYLQNTKQIEKISKQAREDANLLRERYDVVIEKYDKERILFFEERNKIHSQIVQQIERLEKTVEKQDTMINAIKDKLDALLLIRQKKIQ
jgi:hypothetical protein